MSYPITRVSLDGQAINVQGTVDTHNYVWDVNTLSWIKSQVSGTTSSVSVSNFPSVYPVTDNGGSLTVDTPQLPSALTGSGSLKVALVEGASAAISYGTYNNNTYYPTNITSSGQLYTNSPILPSNSLHTESLTAVFQTDAVYGTAQTSVTPTVSGSGSVSSTGSQFTTSTGTTVNSQAVLQSRSRVRYRPGQAVLFRFSGYYSSPVANSYQLMGAGHSEDGVYFGYQGTSFGILYVKNGVREQRTLTINVGSNTSESVTVRLDGVDYTVAVTNSGNTYRTAYEISLGNFNGWKAEPIGSTILFVSDSSGPRSGSYSLTASTASGSFSQTKAGVASTDTWIPQSSWNGDRLDGSGPSGITLDPSNGNIYQIAFNCLGFGSVSLSVETTVPNTKQTEVIDVHTIEANTGTGLIFSNPSFPFTMLAYSYGSTSNVSVSCSSFSGFIVGERTLKGPVLSFINSASSVNSTEYVPMFTIRNSRAFGGRSNQSVVNVLSIAGAVKHTQPVTIYLLFGATLGGNPNFSQFSSNSSCQFDTSATSCTISTNNQIVCSFPLSEVGNFLYAFDSLVSGIQLQPGGSITIAAKAVAGNPSYVVASLNTREEQ